MRDRPGRAAVRPLLVAGRFELGRQLAGGIENGHGHASLGRSFSFGAGHGGDDVQSISHLEDGVRLRIEDFDLEDGRRRRGGRRRR
jgi:hypothetical protein